jgi:hypothetical protein
VTCRQCKVCDASLASPKVCFRLVSLSLCLECYRSPLFCVFLQQCILVTMQLKQASCEVSSAAPSTVQQQHFAATTSHSAAAGGHS